MKEESLKKIEEFKKEYGIQELSVDDLDSINGGVSQPVGLNTQDSISAFCNLVDVLIISEGLESAIRFVSQIIPSPVVKDVIRDNGVQGLGTYLTKQMTDTIGGIGSKMGGKI